MVELLLGRLVLALQQVVVEQRLLQLLILLSESYFGCCQLCVRVLQLVLEPGMDSDSTKLK